MAWVTTAPKSSLFRPRGFARFGAVGLGGGGEQLAIGQRMRHRPTLARVHTRRAVLDGVITVPALRRRLPAPGCRGLIPDRWPVGQRGPRRREEYGCRHAAAGCWRPRRRLAAARAGGIAGRRRAAGLAPCRGAGQPDLRSKRRSTTHVPRRPFPACADGGPAGRHQSEQLPARDRPHRVRRPRRRVARHGAGDRRPPRRAGPLRDLSQAGPARGRRRNRRVGHRADRRRAAARGEDRLHRCVLRNRGDVSGARWIADHLHGRGGPPRGADRGHRPRGL